MQIDTSSARQPKGQSTLFTNQRENRFSNAQTDNTDRLSRFNPFQNTNNQVLYVNQYIVDNGGYYLDRHDRVRKAPYIRTQTQQLKRPNECQIKVQQHRRSLQGLRQVPKEKSLIRKAADKFVGFIGRIIGINQRQPKEDQTIQAAEEIDFQQNELNNIQPINNELNQRSTFQLRKSTRTQDNMQSMIDTNKSQVSESQIGKRLQQEELIEDLERNVNETNKYNYRGSYKRQKIDEDKIIKKIQEIQNEKMEIVHQSINSMGLKVSQLQEVIEEKFDNLKQEIIQEINEEMKNHIKKTWREGTDKFYNDAKSIISNHSVNGASSVISELSRSRSASRDYMPQKKFSNYKELVHSQSEDELLEQDFEQFRKPHSQQKNKLQSTFKISPQNEREGAISPIQQVLGNHQKDVKFHLDTNKNDNNEYKQSPAFGMSSNQQEKKDDIKLTNKLVDEKQYIKPVPIKPSIPQKEDQDLLPKVSFVQENNQTFGPKISEKPLGLFGNATTTSDKPATSSSIFGSTNTTSNNNLFTNTPSVPTATLPNSIFKQSNDATDMTKSLFGDKKTEEKNEVKPLIAPVFPFQKPQEDKNKDQHEQKKDEQNKSSLFGQSSLFTSSTPATTQSLFVTSSASSKQETQKNDSAQTTYQQPQPEVKPAANPLLAGIKTVSDNPFLKPTSNAGLSFGGGNLFKPQVTSLGTNSNVSQPQKDDLEIKASKSDMSCDNSFDDIKPMGSIFGANKPSQPPMSGGLFGASSLSAPQAQSLFGSSPNPIANQPSLFTNTTIPQTNNFMAPQQQNAFGQGSLFGKQDDQNINKNLFGAPTQFGTQNNFQQAPPSQNVFQQNTLFGNSAQQQPTMGGGLFNSQQTQQPMGGFGGGFGTGFGVQQSNPMMMQSQPQISKPAPVFGNVQNIFGTPKKTEEESDGLFDMGSAKKNNSSAKKKR